MVSYFEDVSCKTTSNYGSRNNCEYMNRRIITTRISLSLCKYTVQEKKSKNRLNKTIIGRITIKNYLLKKKSLFEVVTERRDSLTILWNCTFSTSRTSRSACFRTMSTGEFVVEYTTVIY